MWDPYSDQPYRIKGEDKARRDPASLLEYAKTAATAVALAPWPMQHRNSSPNLAYESCCFGFHPGTLNVSMTTSSSCSASVTVVSP